VLSRVVFIASLWACLVVTWAVSNEGVLGILARSRIFYVVTERKNNNKKEPLKRKRNWYEIIEIK